MLKPFKPNDCHQFKPLLVEIEEDPGSPLGPCVFWLVIVIFAFFIIWSIFGDIDMVVTARGKVIPAGDVKQVQPLNGGVISAILVKEGDLVKKGQPLIVIDPSTTAPQLESSQQTLAYIKMEQARLHAATGKMPFGSADHATQGKLYVAALGSLQKQLQAKAKIMASFNAQIQAKLVERQHAQAALAQHQEKEARLREVLDIIPKDDYETVKADILTEQDRMQSLHHEIEQLQAQKLQTQEEMGYLRENFQATSLAELSEKEKQITQLKANIQESTFKNARQTLVSPVDGTVHELFVHTVSGVVTPAQKVISIVPANTPMTVQTIVANKDIGFVKVGMPVALKIDTFDFQKYGTLKGQVTHIDADSRDDQKLGPVYTVWVKPLQTSLLVEGKPQTLSSGLSLTTEVKVGKRRIIEFFIYPLIKHLDEGMSVR